jgi:hypothetical protein
MKKESIEEVAKNYTKDGTTYCTEKTFVERGFIKGYNHSQQEITEFKGTRGNAEITICQISERISVKSGLFQIAEVFSYDVLCGSNDTEEAEANANLIVDAFKVRQQINCELSELKEQRDEMLEMLESLRKHIDLCLYYNDVVQLIKKIKER